MRITVEVAGIGQKMDLHTSKVTHTLELLLPDGSSMLVAAEEKDVERLVQLSVGVAPEETRTQDVPQASSDSFQIFGGSPPPTTPTEPAAPERPAGSTVPSKTVPTDEMGNPIVPRSTMSHRGAPILGHLEGEPEDDGDRVPPL
jgi:hypothetical protein